MVDLTCRTLEKDQAKWAGPPVQSIIQSEDVNRKQRLHCNAGYNFPIKVDRETCSISDWCWKKTDETEWNVDVE